MLSWVPTDTTTGEVGVQVMYEPEPLKATFGLSQRERLESASEIAYGRVLERTFRSRLILRLDDSIGEVDDRVAFAKLDLDRLHVRLGVLVRVVAVDVEGALHGFPFSNLGSVGVSRTT